MTEEETRQALTLSRASALKRLGAFVAAASTPGFLKLLRPDAAAALPEAQEALLALEPPEAATVRATIARIIPSEPGVPGALEARADRYIDRALSSALNNLRPFYRTNLAAMDAYSRRTYGPDFASLPSAQQDAVLTTMQANTASGFTPDSRTFFNFIREHTLQGTFGDPYHGGNANLAGWTLLNYPGVKLSATPNEQRLDVAIRPARKSAYAYDLFAARRRMAKNLKAIIGKGHDH